MNIICISHTTRGATRGTV